MTVLKYIVGGLVLTLLVIATYVAWQNRASDKVINSFITVALAGAAATLVATLFSINAESLEISIYKTYVFDKITKYPLHDISKSFIHAFSGPELEFDTWFLVQESVKKDPSLAFIEPNEPDKKLIDRGKVLYRDILFRQVLTILCSRYDARQLTKRIEDLSGGTVYTVDKQLRIPTREIKWDDIVKWNQKSTCLSLPVFGDSSLAVPLDASVNGTESSIHIKDKFLDLRIVISDKGGSLGVANLRSLLQVSSGESMRYWSEQYEIGLKAVFSPIRSGHPLMTEYRNWVESLIEGMKYQFSTQQHWEKAKDLFILYKDLPVETPQEAIQSQKEYYEWFAEQVAKQDKEKSGVGNNNKQTEPPD